MPSIKGIEIRDFKQTETHRGIAYEAALYIDGEKAGHFENAGHGGCTNVMILNEKDYREHFRNRVAQYYKENPATTESEEEFVEELMALWDDLKVFEKSKGKILLAVSSYSRLTPIEEVPMDDLVPTYHRFNNEQKLEEFLSKEKPKFYKVYKTLEDFDIK